MTAVCGTDSDSAKIPQTSRQTADGKVLLNQQSEVDIARSKTTPHHVAGVSKQCSVIFGTIHVTAWYRDTEHKAQHRSGYKPVWTDAKGSFLAWARARSNTDTCIILITHLAQQSKQLYRFLLHYFQFIVIHIVSSFSNSWYVEYCPDGDL